MKALFDKSILVISIWFHVLPIYTQLNFVKNDDNYESLKNFDEDALQERSLCYNSNSNAIEDCENDRGGFEFIKAYGKREPNPHFATKISQKSIRTPSAHSNQVFSCSCEAGLRLLDLGIAYYPRHLITRECKTGKCHGGFRCHPRKYEIHLLKKKEPEDMEQPPKEANNFPETLRDSYQPEIFDVTVACECMP